MTWQKQVGKTKKLLERGRTKQSPPPIDARNISSKHHRHRQNFLCGHSSAKHYMMKTRRAAFDRNSQVQ